MKLKGTTISVWVRPESVKDFIEELSTIEDFPHPNVEYTMNKKNIFISEGLHERYIQFNIPVATWMIFLSYFKKP